MNFKEIIRSIILLLCLILTGFVLIVLSYCIPIQHIKNNIYLSSDLIINEGNRHLVISDNRSTIEDGFTDALMMSECIIGESNNPLEDAMRTSYANIKPDKKIMSPPLALYYLVNDSNADDVVIVDYPRYWHGYLIFLKPLFFFFDRSVIRIISIVFCILLFILTCYIINREIGFFYMISFILSELIFSPIVYPYSFQIGMIFYISCFSIILFLIRRHKTIENMIIIGFITSYFDLLTCPTVPLGLILTLLIVIH